MPCCGCCCAKVGGECCGPEDDRNCCKPDEGICCGPDGETQVCCPPERDCCSVYTIGEGEAEVCCAESQYCCFGEANPTAGICCEDTEVCCPGDVAASCCSPNQYCCDGVCSDTPCCAGSCDDENPCDEGCYCCDGVCQDEPCEECAADEDCPAVWFRYSSECEDLGPFDTEAEAAAAAPTDEAPCFYAVASEVAQYCCNGVCQVEECAACQQTAGITQPAGTDCATVEGYTVYGGVDPSTGDVVCLQTGCRPSSSFTTACCPDNCVDNDPNSPCFQDDPP